MTKESGIYMLVNKSNGHRYVGQTICFRKRWIQHRTKTHQGRSVIGRAFRKHGKDAFLFVIVERCQADHLDAREIHHIAALRPEYNMNKGGDGNRGYMVQQEMRSHLSVKSKAWWKRLSEEERRAIVERIQKNRRPVSAETRAKMSVANKRFWAGKTRTTSALQKRRASEVNRVGMIGNRRGVRRVIDAKEST